MSHDSIDGNFSVPRVCDDPLLMDIKQW